MPVVGLGMDICSIDRIQRILDGPRAEKFLERVYTEAERALCSSRQDAAAAFAARLPPRKRCSKPWGRRVESDGGRSKWFQPVALPSFASLASRKRSCAVEMHSPCCRSPMMLEWQQPLSSSR